MRSDTLGNRRFRSEPARALGNGFAQSCWLSALVVTMSACGSSRGSPSNGAGGARSDSSAGSAAVGGLEIDIGMGAAGSGGAGTPETCAGELIQAERVPLDIYIMLDVSGSMLDATASDPNVTKWRAVSSALADFAKDPQSEGIGLGLQLFPIVDHAAPAKCTVDRECGAYGPCLNHGCWPRLDGELVSCIQNSDCATTQQCKPIGACSKASKRACDASSAATCGVDPIDGDLGSCVPNPSVCLSSNDCRLKSYETPAQPITPLPLGRDAFLSIVANASPEEAGLTPTGPALTGAIEQASTWAIAHPDHQVVALLATDGVPTLKTDGATCAMVSSADDVSAVVDVAGAGRAKVPSISTFVIGVLGTDVIDVNAPEILDAIAVAGGTERAFILSTMDDVQAQFSAALNQIRGAKLACDLKIPEAQPGKKLDYGRVNVRFNGGSGETTLGYVVDAQHCTQDGGWYYDTNPAERAPQRILTCPVSCDAFQRADLGSVKIELGCRTVVK